MYNVKFMCIYIYRLYTYSYHPRNITYIYILYGVVVFVGPGMGYNILFILAEIYSSYVPGFTW